MITWGFRAGILLLWLVVFPWLTGEALFFRRNRLPEKIVYGALAFAGMFEVCCIPAAVFHQPLHRAMLAWMLLWAGLVLAGLLRRKRHGCFLKKDGKKRSINLHPDGMTVLLLICVLGLILAACGFYIFRMHIDDDDARYVANALAAWESDTIYRYHPNTGEVMDYFVGEVSKDLVSVIMIYYAAVSRLTGMHPTIMIHGFWPVYWLLLGALAFRMVAVRLYEKERDRLYFQLICHLVQCMGNVSVYTGSSFTLLRLWQGKALIPALIVPLGICLLLDLYKDDTAGWYGSLLVLNLFACFCSGNGIYLSAILSVLLCLLRAVRERRWKPLAAAVAVCLPNLCFTCIYVMADRMILR